MDSKTQTPIKPAVYYVNLYDYAQNNPIMLVDMTGRSAELGSSYPGEYNPIDCKPRSTEKVAQFQLNAMKKYLQVVGVAQAKGLGLSGVEAERFMAAESNAISMTKKDGKFFLSVDEQLAKKGRGGHAISWVLERLQNLTQSRSMLRVVTANRIFVPYGEASGRTFPKIMGGSQPYIPVGIRTDSIKEGYAGRPLSSVGRTIVHELVIHAWREFNWPKEENMGSFKYSGHILLPDRKHFNWTDIEAEVLSHYEALYAPFPAIEMLFRKPGVKSPEKSELLDSYRRQLKEEREMLERAGGIMGTRLH